MHTLSKELTARVLLDPTAYTRLRQHWSAMMRASPQPPLGPQHHLLYLALIGEDWRKGFTPVTNPRKIANGGYHNWGLVHGLRRVKFDLPRYLLAPFDGIVTVPMLVNLRLLLPKWYNVRAFTPELFSDGKFPFEAYTLPGEWQVSETDA